MILLQAGIGHDVTPTYCERDEWQDLIRAHLRNAQNVQLLLGHRKKGEKVVRHRGEMKQEK